jgi:diguanylate cyclase (GGDEF)-like protein
MAHRKKPLLQARFAMDQSNSAATDTPEAHIAGLELQLAETRLQLAAAIRDLENSDRRLQDSSAKLHESEVMANAALGSLKASLDREKLTLAFAEIGICEYDVKTGMVSTSEMTLRQFGLRGGTPELHCDALFGQMHAEDRSRFSEAIEQCVIGKGNLDIEYRVAAAGGDYRWLSTKGDAMLDLDGEPMKILWVTEDISRRKDMDARVRFLAHHDLLTGLPNRSLFQDRMQQAIAAAKRVQSRIALLFIDIDHFKQVNDTLGHRAGDILLQKVAARLRDCVRDTDTVCRHAGDEYLIALTSLHEPAEAARIGEKVVATFEETFDLDGHETRVSASVGISLYPDDGQTVEDLIRNADAAMYQAKNGGRNRFASFTRQGNAAAAQRLARPDQLLEAIAADRLVLRYEPQFELATGRLIGVEATVGWSDAERGLLDSDSLMALAGNSDMVHPIGAWMLNNSCRQLAQWQAAGLKVVPLAIDLSCLLRRSALAGDVAEAIARNSISAHLLEVQFTESAIVQAPAEAARTLERLHGTGVSLSVKDFGTGYTSPNYLKRFPVDKLKIDHGLVADLSSGSNDVIIARAIIDLARGLRVKVVANGVETRSQLDALASLGCEAYQGPIAGKPADAANFALLLK